ncbi:serine/threonine-protein kinase [Limnoglobus roseus]|uniref:serine/threonine-protein kinase n=1 Tax=Limnoglobus roseus TaxID=2598579 RepID=UPI00143DF124|nr:serine/threonine-protein kinase [Limnoglobus roseus]
MTADGLFPIEVDDLLRRLGLDDAPELMPGVLPESPPGYLLESEIGRGGMGVVYRAAQPRLKRTVAVKMVRFAGGPDSSTNRFFLEAELLALVHHPNVVPIYDFGDTPDGSFLVLEYLPGGNLAQRLKTGPPLTVGETVALGQTLAGAVQALHDVGVVHRDLKPSNILFTADGAPKIADFGLAKRPATTDLTATHSYLGTPAYMSPEQAGGRTRFVGPESDTYSLGVILFECLTGRLPFVDENPWQLMRQIVENQPPSPRRFRPDVPRGLELIVLKCLEKQPHRRYATTASLAADLAAVQAGRAVQARPTATVARVAYWARSHPLTALLAGLALVTAVGLALALAQSYETRGQLRHQELLAEQRQTERLLADETARLREAESQLARVDANRAEELAELLASVFRPAATFPAADLPHLTPWEVVRQTTAEDLLADAVRRLDHRWPGDALTRAKVRLVLGEALLANGSFEDARPNLEDSLAVRRAALPADHPDVARSEYAMARLWDETGDYAKAMALYRRVERIGPPALRDKAHFWRIGLAIAVDPGGPLPTFSEEPRTEGDCVAQAVGWLQLAKRHRVQGDAAAARAALAAGDKRIANVADEGVRATWGGRLAIEAARVELLQPLTADRRALLERSLNRTIEDAEGVLGEGNAVAALARSELAQVEGGDAAAADLQTATDDLRRTISLAHPEALPHAVRVAAWHRSQQKPAAARAILEDVGRACRDRYRHDNAHAVAWLIERALLEEELGDPNAAAGYTEEVIRMVAGGKLWLPLMTYGRRDRLASRLRQYPHHVRAADRLDHLGTAPPTAALTDHD